MAAVPTFKFTSKVPLVSRDRGWLLDHSCRDGRADWSRGIRDQRQHGANENDPDSEPDPHHQRIQVRLDDGLSLFILAFIDQVEILFHRGTNTRLGRSLTAGLIEEALRGKRVDLVAILIDVHDGPLAGVVRTVILRVRAADQVVVADVHLVAIGEAVARFLILIECRAGESDDDNDDTEVNDVATIAARVAMRELDHGGEHALAGVVRNYFAAPVVLAGDGERDQDREADRHQRIEVRDVLPRAEPEGRSPRSGRDHQESHHGDRADRRPQEIPFQAFKRSLAPRQQRADRSQNEKQQRNRNRNSVIERRSDCDFVALHQLGDLREPCAPEHGEAEQYEEKVVEQETRLARDERFELVLAAQMLFILDEEKDEDREADGEEPREPVSDRRLREGVDRADDAASREERSENCKPEGGEDQPHVPDLQHAALFLHHDGVQEGGADEPGHQRSILDGIPPPVASPAEYGVSPVSAEKNSARQKSPRNHSPAASDVNPFLTGILHDQSAEREGEGDSESNVAEIKHRRVDHHLGILQEWIQSTAVGTCGAFEQAEGLRREVHERKKEDLEAAQNKRSIGEEARIGFVAKAENEAVSGEQERPEEQGSFLSGQERGEFVRAREVAIAVMKDVGDGEIVAESRDDEGECGEEQRSKEGDSSAA